MWLVLAGMLLATARSAEQNSSIFNNNHIIFRSTFNITSLLVPATVSKNIQTESSDLPSVFFAVADPRFDGGSCIFVLEDLAAYEILEGGRDATADYVSGDVFFGAKDGIYVYNAGSLSSTKLGSFRDDIIQLQKANGTDIIYYLNQERKMFKLEKRGTVKTRLQNVVCATQFVLDTSNNIYFVQCGDQMIHIIKSDGTVPGITALLTEEYLNIKLVRPAFIMDDCIPFLGDGDVYILFSNGTLEKKDITIPDKPSAISVDAALYLVVSVDGKIYEYNIMEMMLNSMFGKGSGWAHEVEKIIMSVISSKDNFSGFYRGWYKNLHE